jgi:hypothetical protein
LVSPSERDFIMSFQRDAGQVVQNR